MVFVNQIVAVEHVKAVPRAVAGEDSNALALVEPDDVFEGGLLIWQDSVALAFCAADDLKVLWVVKLWYTTKTWKRGETYD